MSQHQAAIFFKGDTVQGMAIDEFPQFADEGLEWVCNEYGCV